MSLYQVEDHFLCNMHSTYTKLWSGRIDDVTTGQFSDSRNHVLELCIENIQAYIGKEHSMLPVGIMSCDIPFSHRDGKMRASIYC